MVVILWALVGYVAGSLPSAWIAARASGRPDVTAGIEREDSGGDAHFVLRSAGAGRLAASAATADVLKAFIAVLAARRVAGTTVAYSAGACAIGAVAGHCWPPALRRFAGRGLSAAAGAFLAILPFEMVVAGIVTATGSVRGFGGAASTAGFGLVPVVATLRGQPGAYRFAAWTIVAMIVARRLEGLPRDAGRRAVVRRVVLDE